MFIFTILAYLTKPQLIIVIYLWTIFYTVFSLNFGFIMFVFTKHLGKKNWNKLGDESSSALAKSDNEATKNESGHDYHNETTVTQSPKLELDQEIENHKVLPDFPVYQEIKMVSLDI